ncbi:MAG: ATP synthase F1 subunit gamma [Erysipelotrichaceae bacterium]|nr:ATP synthase F1 subunit gamma [Erysipelotrichaceae bacterium]
MAANKQAIKNRIRGIKTTKKITKAMELIAIGKLKRQRDLFDANKFYALSLKETITNILSNTQESNNVYLQKRVDDKPLTIVFLSDFGLCGGYTGNTTRLVSEEASENEQLLVIGIRGKQSLIDNGFKTNYDDIACDSMNYNELFKIADSVVTSYRNNEISSINIVYTQYINSMSFVPIKVRLLPVEATKKENLSYKEVLYEPSIDQILDELIPLYIKSLVYSYWLETTTSEHSSRRLAMDLATDNAEDLIDNLTLVYNRARQAAITQEINEIVMTADAI